MPRTRGNLVKNLSWLQMGTSSKDTISAMAILKCCDASFFFFSRDLHLCVYVCVCAACGSVHGKVSEPSQVCERMTTRYLSHIQGELVPWRGEKDELSLTHSTFGESALNDGAGNAQDAI